KTHCGVACFVKDNPQRSYYIRIYNEAAKIWEQEMYNQFCYITPRPYFHTFEANDYQAGLSFADDQEAASFFAIIQEKMQVRQQRKQGLEKRPDGINVSLFIDHQHSPMMSLTFFSIYCHIIYLIKFKLTGFNAHAKGSPIKHDTKCVIACDEQTNTMDPHLKSLFDMVGISETQLQDESTSKLIYDVIAQHGGVEGVRNEMQHRGPLPQTPRKLPPVPSKSPATIRRPTCTAAPSPPPQRGVCSGPPPPPPPPPPPTGKMRGPPPPPIPPPSNSASSAIPPPPPPMSKKPTMQQSNDDNDTDAGDGRSALLQQIRGGMALKRVSFLSDIPDQLINKLNAINNKRVNLIEI
uniref:Wiskott-Aldrich syndrome protein n=1 Tax=Eptatretus burgeri TaxID=7764 RepID=A0A8C4R5B2_EPTBU